LNTPSTRAACLAFSLIAIACSASAQSLSTATTGALGSNWFDEILRGTLHEEPARFLPGNYLFKKGNEYYQHGQADTAVRLWTVAAYWAQKGAQYNLGILYFKGDARAHVIADKPLGAAWLAIAAERNDAVFQASLAAAMAELDEAERERANAIWRGLRASYADAATVPRARAQFNRDVRAMTGSRTGGDAALPLSVISPREGSYNGSQMLAKKQAEADAYFGSTKEWIDVKPLRTLDAVPPADSTAPSGSKR
jgi:TPR repeat protein